MPILRVRTPEGIELRHEVAGLGSRLAAGLLDLLVLGGAYSLLMLVVVVAAAVLGPGLDALPQFLAGVLGGGAIGVGILYPLLFHLLWAGQTPGKRQLGLRVASADGYPASTFQLLVRGLIVPIDVLLVVPAPLGLILIALTPRCQRLGDLVASTLVVRERAAASSEEPWPSESWSTRVERGLELAPGLAARLTEEDLRFLRDVILRQGLAEEHATRLYREVADHYAARLGFEPLPNLRRTLKELYLFAREARGGAGGPVRGGEAAS